jgi:hypothetical protein
VFVCLPGACWNDRCRSEREAEAETQTFSEWINNGLISRALLGG